MDNEQYRCICIPVYCLTLHCDPSTLIVVPTTRNNSTPSIICILHYLFTLSWAHDSYDIFNSVFQHRCPHTSHLHSIYFISYSYYFESLHSPGRVSFYMGISLICKPCLVQWDLVVKITQIDNFLSLSS